MKFVLLSERYLLYESWYFMNYEKILKKALSLNNSVLIEEVFEEIYKEYYSLVVYIISKYETNKQNIEEILNDVFFNFYKALSSSKINNIKYYLVQCAKNKTIDFLKKKQIKVEYNDEIILNYCENHKTTYYETVSRLKKILSEYEINIILLHDIYNYTFKELSKKYNKKESSIKSTYHRVLKKIKEKINEL